MNAYKLARNPRMGRHLVASRDIKKDEKILVISDYVLKDTPCRFSIQLSLSGHALLDLSLSFMNHSCEPNLFIDTQTLSVVALRDVVAGDPLTFFYPSSEWEMKNSFACLCGSERCLKIIDGAKFVRRETLGLYRVNPHIEELKLLQQQIQFQNRRLSQAEAGRTARRVGG